MTAALVPLIAAMTLFATAVMAASAAIQAARNGFDPFGATVLAIATALGGGTVRDLLLGRTPVFWIGDTSYLLVAVPVALITFGLARRADAGSGRRQRLLMQLDAAGLALFTLVGTDIALQAGTPAVVAVVIGCVTGTVGGMIRDVLCGEAPSVLREDLYATISLAGGAVYVGLLQIAGGLVPAAVGFMAMLMARLLVIWRSGRGAAR